MNSPFAYEYMLLGAPIAREEIKARYWKSLVERDACQQKEGFAEITTWKWFVFRRWANSRCLCVENKQFQTLHMRKKYVECWRVIDDRANEREKKSLFFAQFEMFSNHVLFRVRIHFFVTFLEFFKFRYWTWLRIPRKILSAHDNLVFSIYFINSNE